MIEGEELYTTDRSLSKSMSLSFSDSTRTESSDDGYDNETRSSTSSRSKNSKSRALAPPEKKLETCERKLKSFHESRDTENAFSELIQLVPLRRLVFGERHWKYAEAHSKLAEGYLEYKQYKTQAVNHAEKAKTLILTCDSPGANEKSLFTKCVVELYLVLGKALTFQGQKYKDAENALTKSWQVMKNLDKQTSSIQIPSINAISVSIDLKYKIKCAFADVYIATKEIDKAISALNDLVELITKNSSENDERLVTIYSKMMKAERTRKKSQVNHEMIIEYALKAHDVSSACHALNSIEVADTAFALGKSYASIDSDKTLSAAETYFNEALKVYQTSCGAKNPKTLQVQDALAKIWMREGKDDEVIKALKSSLPKKCDAYGECSSQVAETHKLIAGIFLTKGDLSNAHKYLNQCLNVEQELYGLQHWKTNNTKKMIAQLEDNPKFTKSSKAKLAERPKFQSTIKSPK